MWGGRGDGVVLPVSSGVAGCITPLPLSFSIHLSLFLPPSRLPRHPPCPAFALASSPVTHSRLGRGLCETF